ncbi:MAG TPA: ABC transporter permease [Chromatiaceae bacterium]|jgi:NitT/TauT family transport system permease protein|nr:ABC transporter permease [Chromatiaceae bacterium]HIB84003.1 ABC transporter permease [Chromatiaceae bacterium]HIN82007.1 ABC transporter permease [Chromatiales bacterium]HIO14102.1 ABC transporter permease [Chromatiales bacterium]HIO54251.1 ABC transporter permease [Chromatiales bacterium]
MSEGVGGYNQHDALKQRLRGLMVRIKRVEWQRILVSASALVGAVVVWQLLAMYQFNYIISFENIPTPVVVFEQFLKLIVTEEFYLHIGASLQRIGIAFTSASIMGVIVGIFMGRSRIFHDIMMPYIEILRPIPAVAWIPLAILMFPTEESSIIYITYLGTFFPVVLNTVHGVEQTPEALVRAAKSLGAGTKSILWHVILPGALPSIMAGLAIGMGVAWFSLLAGEIISGQYGIGYFTWNSYTLIEYPNIIIGMLTIGGLGTLSTYLVRQASKPALRWQEHKE